MSDSRREKGKTESLAEREIGRKREMNEKKRKRKIESEKV